MITNIVPQILVLAPKGVEGIGVAAAACRASALGIIDITSENRGEANATCHRLASLTAGAFGVRISADDVLNESWLAYADCRSRGVSVSRCIPVTPAKFEEAVQVHTCIRAPGPCGGDVASRGTPGDRCRGRTG